MFVPLAEANSGHRSSLYLSAAELARADTPDLPHMPERDMTFDTPSSAPGTARTNMLIGLVPPVPWDGLGRYGSYGLNIFGD
jgi:hypothetical protein